MDSATHLTTLQRKQLGVGKYEFDAGISGGVGKQSIDAREPNKRDGDDAATERQASLPGNSNGTRAAQRAKRKRSRSRQRGSGSLIGTGDSSSSTERQPTVGANGAIVALGGRGLVEVEGSARSIGDDAVAVAVSGRVHHVSGAFDMVRQGRCVLLGGSTEADDAYGGSLGGYGYATGRGVNGGAGSGTFRGDPDMAAHGAHAYKTSLRQGSGVHVRWIDCGERIDRDPD